MSDPPDQNNIEPQKSQDEVISKLDDKIVRLQLELNITSSIIREKTQKIKEYGEFVDPITFNCWKLKHRK